MHFYLKTISIADIMAKVIYFTIKLLFHLKGNYNENKRALKLLNNNCGECVCVVCGVCIVVRKPIKFAIYWLRND